MINFLIYKQIIREKKDNNQCNVSLQKYFKYYALGVIVILKMTIAVYTQNFSPPDDH